MNAATPGKAWGLRRLADARGRFKMLAVDQRPPIMSLVSQARGEREPRDEDVCTVKRLLVEELASHASAVLLDPHFAYPAAIDAVPAAKGLLVTLEDAAFVETGRGRMSHSIDDWNVDKIRRIGGDAVKLLAWYRPDADPGVVEHQKEYVAAVGEACRRYDIPFLFELLVYPFPGEQGHATGHTGHPRRRADHVIESVETFSDPVYGIDVFKLESPIRADLVPDPDAGDAEEIRAAREVFAALGASSPVPWVMLSAGATKPAFTRILRYAYEAGASGFLAGRAIWWDELAAFPDVDACRRALGATSAGYLEAINALTDEMATPIGEERVGPEPCPGAPPFRHDYRSIVP